MTLNNFSLEQKKEWSKFVKTQMKDKNIDFNQKAIFLCGNNYSMFLKQAFVEYETPFM